MKVWYDGRHECVACTDIIYYYDVNCSLVAHVPFALMLLHHSLGCAFFSPLMLFCMCVCLCVSLLLFDSICTKSSALPHSMCMCLCHAVTIALVRNWLFGTNNNGDDDDDGVCSRAREFRPVTTKHKYHITCARALALISHEKHSQFILCCRQRCCHQTNLWPSSFLIRNSSRGLSCCYCFDSATSYGVLYPRAYCKRVNTFII